MGPLTGFGWQPINSACGHEIGLETSLCTFQIYGQEAAVLSKIDRFRNYKVMPQGPCAIADHFGRWHLRIIEKYILFDSHYPTLPSRLIATSFCASTANSIGNFCITSRTKPLTSRATASSWLNPRCWA